MAITTLQQCGEALSGEFAIESDQLLNYLDRFESQTARIKVQYPNRNPVSIDRNNWDGMTREIGVVNGFRNYEKTISTDLNPREHDVKDPLSYAYDVDWKVKTDHIEWPEEDLRNEIKKLNESGDVDTFYFNYMPGDSPGLDLTTFINKGTKICDFLILVNAREEAENCRVIVKPRYVIKADMFTNYLKKSSTGESHLSHNVDLKQMIVDGNALKIQ